MAGVGRLFSGGVPPLRRFKKKVKDYIENRREHRVLLVDYYLYYLKDPLRDASAIRGEVISLSRSGILFEGIDTFALGHDLALKLQIPYRNEFVRATGKVIRIEKGEHSPKVRVAVTYTKILNGPKELLFDTLVRLLTEEKGEDD